MNATVAPLHTGWARPRLQEQVLRPRRDGRSDIVLRVDGLDDARRALHVEQVIAALPGVARVSLERAARRARVVLDSRRTPLPALLDAFAAAGCPARPLHTDAIDDPRRREAHASLKRLLVAGLFAMQAMMFATVLYVGAFDDVDSLTRELFRWLGLLSATPVVGYAALPFFRGAVHDLHARRLGTDVPVALAMALIYGASAVAALRGSGEVYFDSVSMFVFVLLLGRHLEMRARHRNGALGDAAIEATPLTAERRRADGGLELVAAAELEAGDHVHVGEGGVVPADGTVDNAGVRVDQALLSGEARPQYRRHGDDVAAGSVVVEGPLELRVVRSGACGTLARIGALATHARDGRRRLRGSDAAARRFVSRVLVLTAGTALFWLWHDATRAFDAAVAVLVVACPCAFALAAPAATTRALGALAARGVLVADALALHTLARADHAVFDKTGTLTRPCLDMAAIEPLRGDRREDVLRLAAALARESSHPAARAVYAAAGDMPLPRARHVEIVAGGGIRGEVEGRALQLGRCGFARVAATAAADSDDTDALVLADADGALARLHLDERLRDDAVATLHALGADGMSLQIASGDAPVRVARVAGQTGIDDWQARQRPADKLQQVAARRRQGAVVLAVGDGSNDAPVLAGADVSAALAGGTALAQAHADILLLGDRLAGLPLARRIARRAGTVLAQNRTGALAYNLCAVPFAAAGLVPPWLAAIGMSLSSLAVVLNAWRIGADESVHAAAPHERAA